MVRTGMKYISSVQDVKNAQTWSFAHSTAMIVINTLPYEHYCDYLKNHQNIKTLTESVILLSQVTQMAEAERKTRNFTTVSTATFCSVGMSSPVLCLILNVLLDDVFG